MLQHGSGAVPLDKKKGTADSQMTSDIQIIFKKLWLLLLILVKFQGLPDSQHAFTILILHSAPSFRGRNPLRSR
jgi:hypothetical protein